MLKLKIETGKNRVPILSAAKIDHLAQKILTDYKPEQLETPQPFDVDEFLELYLGMEKDYKYLSHNGSILGMTAFNTSRITVYDAERHGIEEIIVSEGTALIDLGLLEEGQEQRERFTAAHEGGHWLLHKEVFKNGNVSISCKTADIEQNVKRTLTTDKDWIEWQADYIASALLMPVNTFKSAFFSLCREAGIRKNCIWLGANDDNDLFAAMLPEMLGDVFNVSKRAAAIRLRKLGLVIENGRGETAAFA